MTDHNRKHVSEDFIRNEFVPELRRTFAPLNEVFVEGTDLSLGEIHTRFAEIQLMLFYDPMGAKREMEAYLKMLDERKSKT